MKSETLILLGVAAVGAAIVFGGKKKRPPLTDAEKAERARERAREHLRKQFGDLPKPKEGEPPGPEPGPGEPGFRMEMGPGVTKPINPPPEPGASQHFREGYEAAVDDCLQAGLEAKNFDAAVLELKMCALSQLFPENIWPPPQPAHNQWTQMWIDQRFDSYVRGLLQGGVPG